MKNSNDLTNIFTLEDFLLASIFHWKMFPCWQTSYCRPNLQQQARPVWNTEERELDNLRTFSPARRWSQRLCSRGDILVWPGREGNPGICLQSRTWDRKRMMMTIMIWTPVHLPMPSFVITPNCDKAGLVRQRTCCESPILKSEQGPTCNQTKSWLVKMNIIFQEWIIKSDENVICALPSFTISPLLSLLSSRQYPPTMIILLLIETAAW